MKVTANEYDEAFSIEFEAETVQDPVFLTRWNLNAKKDVEIRNVSAGRNGLFAGWISWQKRADTITSIKR